MVQSSRNGEHGIHQITMAFTAGPHDNSQVVRVGIVSLLPECCSCCGPGLVVRVMWCRECEACVGGAQHAGAAGVGRRRRAVAGIRHVRNASNVGQEHRGRDDMQQPAACGRRQCCAAHAAHRVGVGPPG